MAIRLVLLRQRKPVSRWRSVLVKRILGLSTSVNSDSDTQKFRFEIFESPLMSSGRAGEKVLSSAMPSGRLSRYSINAQDETEFPNT